MCVYVVEQYIYFVDEMWVKVNILFVDKILHRSNFVFNVNYVFVFAIIR